MHSYLMQHLCVIVDELVTISESKVYTFMVHQFLGQRLYVSIKICLKSLQQYKYSC